MVSLTTFLLFCISLNFKKVHDYPQICVKCSINIIGTIAVCCCMSNKLENFAVMPVEHLLCYYTEHTTQNVIQKEHRLKITDGISVVWFVKCITMLH